MMIVHLVVSSFALLGVSAFTFTPAQDTQLLLVMDGQTEEDIHFSVQAIPSGALFPAFNATARTLEVANMISFLFGNDTCFAQYATPWSPPADISSGIHTSNMMAEIPLDRRNILNSVMMAANSDSWSKENSVRKIIMMVSAHIPTFADSITARNITMESCGDLTAPPTKEQFRTYLSRNNIGLIFLIVNCYGNQDTLDSLYKDAKTFGADAGLTDFIVAKWSEYGEQSKTDPVELYHSIFEADWIATTSTTISPRDQLKDDVKKMLYCDM